jgi:hypothetical protein
MKKLLSSDRKTTLLRIAFSIVILSLIISILPAKPSYADDSNLPKYRLYAGDLRESANRPDIIAYANTQHTAPPPEFDITVNGKFWRYYQWISLTEKGSWIKATTNIATDCIGVQFWGDQTDGWARITVDGSEVCRVNTYGKSGKYPGEVFANYVEIYNLPMAKHTIIVDVLGINGQGGGPDVTVFFFGLRKAPATVPPQPAPSPPPPTGVEQLVIDVWTNKGGQGPDTHGGTFRVGEETIVYVQANSTIQARWSISGPSMTNSGVETLEAGETYRLPLGEAEQKDIGQWRAVFEASIPGGQVASDTTSFTVVATGTTPTPPPAPITPPPAPTTTEVEKETAKVNASNATELDALKALKMAEGELDIDLNMDANGDGEVTKEDAQLILQWAVETQGGLLSAPQQEIVDTLGPPSCFTVTYLLDSATEYNAIVRTEIWAYPEDQKQITFIAGDIYAVDDLPAVENEDKVVYPDLKPEDFDCSMDYEQVAARISGDVGAVDLLPEAFKEAGMETYLGDKVFFITVDGQLVHLETFGVEGQLSASEQLKPYLASLNPTNLLAPQPVLAKDESQVKKERHHDTLVKKLFRFFRSIPSRITRGFEKVVEKVARLILPRELVPYAVAIAEFQLGRLPVWQKLAKINDVAKLENELSQLQDRYRQVVTNIGNLVKSLKSQQERMNLALQAAGVDVPELQTRIGYLNELISKLDAAQSKLNSAPPKLEDILRLVSNNVVKKTLRNCEGIVLADVNEQLQKLGLEDVVKTFLEKGPRGLDANTVITLYVNGDVDRMIKSKGIDPNLKDEITKQCLAEWKKNKAAAVNNPKQRLNQLNQIIDNILAKHPQAPQTPKEAKPPAEGPPITWQQINLTGAFTERMNSGDWSANFVNLTIKPQTNDSGMITGEGRATKRDGSEDYQYAFEGVYMKASGGTTSSAKCTIKLRQTSQGKTSDYEGTCGWGGILNSDGTFEGEIFTQDCFPTYVQPRAFELRKE